MSFGTIIINAKVDYALRAVLDMGAHYSNVPAQSREIAFRQSIPGPYLDQILADLKRGGIVRSIRGASGGYTLTVPPDKLTVLDVINALTGDRQTDDTPEQHGTFADSIHILRSELDKSIVGVLDNVTISELINRKRKTDEALSYMPNL